MTPVPGNRWDLLDGREPAEPPSLSVIVPYYRQQAELDRTLAALARQTHPAELIEIIVVDDGSPTAPEVPGGVTLLRQADDGFRAAAARNLGARRATGDILCFLDADTTPEPAYLARMSRLPALLPEAVTVGRRRHAALAGHAIDAAVEDLGPRHELPEPAWLRDEYARTGNLLRADQRSYRFVISAVLCCSAGFFERVGGFDEAFRAYGGEDWEWAHRAWQEGAVLAHVPDAVAWHDGPDWAGRGDASDRAAKNAESLALSERIPVAGSRPRGLITERRDVVVEVAGSPSAPAAFLTADSILAALPQASVVLPSATAAEVGGVDPRVLAAGSDAAARSLATARVTIAASGAIRVDEAGVPTLRDLVESVGVDDLGAVELHGRDGAALTVTARRARRRLDDQGAGFRTERRDALWLRPTGEQPDVAAYLGGWG